MRMLLVAVVKAKVKVKLSKVKVFQQLTSACVNTSALIHILLSSAQRVR